MTNKKSGGRVTPAEEQQRIAADWTTALIGL